MMKPAPIPVNAPNRLTPAIKSNLSLALDALRSDNISKTAREHNTTRRTIYKYKAKATNAVNDIFDTQNNDEVLYVIPVTKDYIKSAVAGLSGICKSSERDIKLYLDYIFDYDISVGKINSILAEISDVSHEVNQSYLLDSCKDSTSDECYHRGDPILSVADIASKFCLLLEREDHIDHKVWEMYLEDLKERGYSPDVNVLDGGPEMNLAYKNIFKDTTLRYDHFHIIKTIKELLRFLDNNQKRAFTEALKSYKVFLKDQNNDTQAAWEEKEAYTTFCEETYKQTKIGLTH